jgi:hypothetical protein
MSGIVILLLLASLLAGCRSESDPSTFPPMHSAAALDLDAEIARASSLGRPVLILVTEPGLSPAEDHARTLFENVTAGARNGGILSIVLDLNISRNRAEAARYHITDTPLLLCLSRRGLIVSRDPQPITKELVLDRIRDVAQRGRERDAMFGLLEEALARNQNGATAQLALADFLLASENAREAIPHLELVARSKAADTARRVRAWVDLARAHLWIAEPEKGRHEAEALITELGPGAPEARAGGNLVLGLQDAKSKRMAVARREFEAAIAAAPDSVYAKQAAAALATFPGEGK